MSFDHAAILAGIDRLRKKGIVIDDGLTNDEIQFVEENFQFTFPPDLRFFLQSGVPSSDYFVNWRGGIEALRPWFDRGIEGILFDVRNNAFWYDPFPCATRLTAARIACTVASTVSGKRRGRGRCRGRVRR